VTSPARYRSALGMLLGLIGAIVCLAIAANSAGAPAFVFWPLGLLCCAGFAWHAFNFIVPDDVA
jgi:hypothetical protein